VNLKRPFKSPPGRAFYCFKLAIFIYYLTWRRKKNEFKKVAILKRGEILTIHFKL
jgi:hypothetical protein